MAALRRRREKLLLGVKAIRSGKLDEDVLSELADSFESVDDLDDLLGSSASATEDALLGEIEAIDELLRVARDLPTHDAKTEVLLEAIGPILDESPGEKVLIFTQYLDTQRYLVDILKARGYETEIFNGKMSAIEKDLAVERFRRISPVLVSTEAGGEGRNLQFSHIMFNYDLPWNPMRIEQRIGRLDRIGQKKDVYVYNFAATDTLEGRILAVLHERIRIFEESVGALDPILGETIETDIRDLMLEHRKDFDVALHQFERDLEERVSEAKAAEEQLGDFIMDTSSFQRDTVDELLGRRRLVSSDDIFRLTVDFLSRYPTAQCQEVGERVYRIAVPPVFRQQVQEMFGVSLREEYEATFWPEVATQEERIDFVAVGHPLFNAILSFCTALNPYLKGEVTLAAVRGSPFDRDGLLFTYLIDFSGGVEDVRRLHGVFVGLDGESAAEVPAESLLTLRIEPTDDGVDTSDLRPDELRETADNLLQGELNRVKPEWERHNGEAIQSKRAKAERLAEYRRQKENRNVRRLEEQLNRLRASTDADQRRIIPAIEGRLREAKERMAAVATEHEEQLARLADESSPVIGARLMSVAYLKHS